MLFVVVTAILLFVALYLGVGSAPPDRHAGHRMATAEIWKPLAIFLLAAGGIGGAGVALYRMQAAEVRQSRAAELRAIAGLKSSQIAFWLDDRKQALEQAARSPFLGAALEEWLAGRSPDVGDLVHRRLEGIRHADEFESVLLVAPDGRVLESAGPAFAPTEELREAMRSAARTTAAVSSNLYRAPAPRGGAEVLDLVAAVRTQGRAAALPIAYIVARSDPRRYLFPLAATAPLGHASGESLLIRRDGDHVVLLAGLRYPAEAPAGLRVPISRHEVAVVRVVLGERNPIESRDYRGVPVLAAGVPVPGSDWFVLAKVDLAEVYAPLIRLVFMATALVAAAMIAAAVLVALWWRSEKLRMGLELAWAEERVSALVEHFASVSRFANDIVILLDDRGRILEANDRALSAYGYTREELLGMSVFDLRGATERDAAAARRQFDAVKTAGDLRFESLHRRKDGTVLPVEVSSRRMEVGGRPYVQSIIRDISERRAHEARIAEISAERDRLLKRLELQFERMPVGCVVSGADLRILQVNAAFERIFGYSREELDRDDAWALLVPQELRSWMVAQLAPLAASDASVTLVNENLTKAGPRITCRWTNTPLHGPSGEFLGLIGMCEDITQQLEIERALRSSEERFRALTEVSPAVVFRTDAEGRCTYVNARWSEISGRAPETALGFGWLGSVHPDDRDAVAAAWRAAVAGGTFRREYRLSRPDGRVAWVLGQATPETGDQSVVVGFVGTVNDITDLKETELALQESRDLLEQRVRERTRELEAAKERAEQADRVKSTFLSTMSHELRTPLNSILGFTDVVLEGLSGPLTEEQRRHLGIVRDSSVHLLALINDVLDLSRIEAGQLRLEIAPVALPDLLRRRVQGFQAEAGRKGLTLSVSIDDGVGTLPSDATRLSQIVDNLLSNAVKFTDAGSVSLAARVIHGMVEVEVSDTGRGIDPQDLPMLFQPFFTHPTGTPGRRHEGVGLGLPIARRLATALGGTIRVTSRPGHGSRFILSLPLEGPG